MKLSRRWLWLLALAPLALGLSRLRLDVEVMNLLPDRFPVVRGLKLYQGEFANARELIITVERLQQPTAESHESGSKESGAETIERAARTIAERLRAAPGLFTTVAWQPLWLERPGESAELISYLWFNQPAAAFGELTNRLSQEHLDATLIEAREALATSFSPQDMARRAYDPLNLTELPESVTGGNGFGEGSELFSSADGTFRLIFAEAKPDISNYRKANSWLEEVKRVVRQTLADQKLEQQVQVRYTGRPAFVTEISSSMEGDITGSVIGTILIIAALFYWAHRTWIPLLWALALLLLVLALTMALGGLIYGTLSIISMGFAAILLGLAVDFALVLYQEARANPHLAPVCVRREVSRGIIWSAVSTAGAFAILNLGGLPGLGQLGTLVATGVTIGAVVMLFLYLGPVTRWTKGSQRQVSPPDASPILVTRATARRRTAWVTTALVVIGCAAVLFVEQPAFDNSADALRPRNSPAYAAVEAIKQNLQRTQEPLWVLIEARDEAEMARRLEKTRAALQGAVSAGTLASFTLPDSLWPQPANQQANRPAAAILASRGQEVSAALLRAGFTSNSFGLTENLLRTWRLASQSTGVFWPTNQSSRWVLEKLMARSNGHLLALGLIYRDPAQPLALQIKPLLALAEKMAPEGVYLSGWEMLGYSIFDFVRGHIPRVLAPMFILLLVSLWLAFRRPGEIMLSLATLAVSGALLFSIMTALTEAGPRMGRCIADAAEGLQQATGSAWLSHLIGQLDLFSSGWKWNLMNLMAIPLLLGAGVDYSIHVQLALQRHGGDIAALRRGVARALLLCGGTTVAGFGSLAWSDNAGMASLGKVCATGIACCMFTALCLLPTWWKAARKT